MRMGRQKLQAKRSSEVTYRAGQGLLGVWLSLGISIPLHDRVLQWEVMKVLLGVSAVGKFNVEGLRCLRSTLHDRLESQVQCKY